MSLKFKEPHVIRATYRIVTPMFIGDAEQKASGISPASVKGALRFWWRALNWGRIRTDTRSDENALKALHAAESDLFGSSVEKGRAARFTLQTHFSGKNSGLVVPQPGIQYLLGQGLYHFRNGYLRDALSAGGMLNVSLVLHPKTKEVSQQKYDQQKGQLVDALMVFGLLGGLGSRARKGFGSLSIQALTVDDVKVAVPVNVSELKKWFSLHQSKVEQPPFTAFSKATRIDVSSHGTDPLGLLNDTGKVQQLYRAYGRKEDATGEHKVNGQKAEQNFSDDHDLVANIIRSRDTPSNIPRRAVFGLPHNYFFSSTGKKADFSPSSQDRSRRASPLFIHVHQFPDEKVALIQSLLPATFLPDGDVLEFKVPKPLKVSFDEKRMIGWNVVHAYLDRFPERENVL